MAKGKTIVAAVAGGALGALCVMPFAGRGRADAGATPGGVRADDAPQIVAATPEQAGRHLVRIAGCNDCHTPGFMQQGEAVPESQWLVGVPLGFKGPWGTTYAPNLRTKAHALTESQWTTFVKNHTGRPPMPWTATHAMSDADRRNLYRYLRSLDPSDNAVPDALEPGQTPTTPYLVFEPVMPTATAQ